MAGHLPLAPKPPGNSATSETPITSPSANRVATRRRNLTRTACVACRTSKTKCDGNRPLCRRCAVKSRQCHYDTTPNHAKTAALEAETARLRADNSALLEMFWRLQAVSTPDAQCFLNFVRGQESLDIPSLAQYFQDRHLLDDQDRQANVSSACNQGLDPINPDRISPQCKSESEDSDKATGPISIVQQKPSVDPVTVAPITVSAVRKAVDMFLRSAGALFHVFTQAEVARSIEEVFGGCQQPDETDFMVLLSDATDERLRAQLAEICGMAAIGTVYLRLPGPQTIPCPPAEAAKVLYTITKLMLEDSMQFSALRAMKLCTLLAIYNITLKGTVALAYIKLGLALGQSHGMDNVGTPSGMSEADFLDYKKVRRTLLLFSGWLDGSLGHISTAQKPSTELLQVSADGNLSEIIQNEIYKVTAIKAGLIQFKPADSYFDGFTIDNFRQELKDFHQALPSNVSIGILFDAQHASPLRANIFYLHLFYLSAMQLLHRRVISNPEQARMSLSATAAISEGQAAARVAARLLSLMRLEGAIVQLCWLCIFSSYTTAVTILQSVAQRIVTKRTCSSCIADLALVENCTQTLHFCAKVDAVALEFAQRVQKYQDVMQESIAMDDDHWEITVKGSSVDYLFETPTSQTNLDKAARDLLQLCQRPFHEALELHPGQPMASLQGSTTLVNWAEAAVGSPQEWLSELQCDVQSCLADVVGNEEPKDLITGLLSTFDSGQFVPDGRVPWKASPPDPF